MRSGVPTRLGSERSSPRSSMISRKRSAISRILSVSGSVRTVVFSITGSGSSGGPGLLAKLGDVPGHRNVASHELFALPVLPDDEGRARRDALLREVDAVLLGDGAPGLEVRQKGIRDALLRGEGLVRPDRVDRNAEHFDVGAALGGEHLAALLGLHRANR